MRNVLTADFHRRSGLVGLQKITVQQEFSKHTLGFLDYRIDNRRDYLLPPENTPVMVRFGLSPKAVGSYYGYVNHYETVTDERDRALTRMIVVGTSKVMNTVNPGTWQDQTRSSIARDFATRHRLRSVIHDHPYVVPNWATGTRTDFQSLKALAEEAGYRLWIDGSTLWFIDPTKLVRTASSMTAQRISREAVKHIRVMGGSNIPGEIVQSTRQIQFGLDYRTNEFFEATSGDPLRPVEVLPTTPNTYTEAQQIADAVERKQQDYYVLKSTFDGDARVLPGALVQFDSGRVNRDQAGLWLTSAATHEITSTDFTTKIVATRGEDQAPLSRVPSTVRGTAGISQAVVRDGVTWEAALQEHVHV